MHHYWHEEHSSSTPLEQKHGHPVSKANHGFVKSTTSIEYFDEDLQADNKSNVGQNRYTDNRLKGKNRSTDRKFQNSYRGHKSEQGRHEVTNDCNLKQFCKKKMDHRRIGDKTIEFNEYSHFEVHPSAADCDCANCNLIFQHSFNGDKNHYEVHYDNKKKVGPSSVKRHHAKLYEDNNNDFLKKKLPFRRNVSIYGKPVKDKPRLSPRSINTFQWETPYNNLNFVKSQINKPLSMHMETKCPAKKWEVNYDNKNFMRSQINQPFKHHKITNSQRYQNVDDYRCDQSHRSTNFDDDSYSTINNNLEEYRSKNYQYDKRVIVPRSGRKPSFKHTHKVKFAVRKKSSELTFESESDVEFISQHMKDSHIKNHSMDKSNKKLRFGSINDTPKGISHNIRDSSNIEPEWYRRHRAREGWRKIKNTLISQNENQIYSDLLNKRRYPDARTYSPKNSRQNTSYSNNTNNYQTLEIRKKAPVMPNKNGKMLRSERYIPHRFAEVLLRPEIHGKDDSESNDDYFEFEAIDETQNTANNICERANGVEEYNYESAAGEGNKDDETYVSSFAIGSLSKQKSEK